MDLFTIIWHLVIGLICMCFGAWTWALSIDRTKLGSVMSVAAITAGCVLWFIVAVEVVF